MMTQRRFMPGLLPTPPELRVSAYQPVFPEWALNQPARFGAGNPNHDWFSEMVALPAQIYPNCFIVCWCLLVMDLIRREHGADAIPEGWGLNPNEIYERFDDARGGKRNQGGLMHTALEWCPKHEGWFEDVRWKAAYFPYKPEYAQRMLAVMPFCIGMATHAGWFSPSRRSGRIARGRPNIQGGHAVHVVDHQYRQGQGFSYFPLQWGADIGHKGYACMDDEHIIQSALSDCITLYLPDGIGTWWKKKLTRIV